MKKIYLIIFYNVLFVCGLLAQDAKVTIDVNTLGAMVSPDLHGIFFEEISHGGEGGLYAELIQNRGFEECRLPQGCKLDSGWLIPPRTPHFSIQPKVSDWKMPWELKSDWPAWSLKVTGSNKAEISLTTESPLNDATPHSLKVDINTFDKAGRVALINEGFWGIRVDKGESYNLSFYMHTSDDYHSPVTASLESDDGKILASYQFDQINTSGWKQYTCSLKATDSNPKAKFYLSCYGKGAIWLDFVSLFPAKTFKNRPNGMRVDLANFLADLKPAFIRWPGGCFVEGVCVESAPNWKRTLGPIVERPGTYSPWGYWSSDGFGYHEYLQFCEDIGASALYVFNCGVSCDFRSGTFIPDSGVHAIVKDALDAIEYAIGPASSKWGNIRARNGHLAPFPLKYVEVGNEQVGQHYGERFNIFYKAIKEKYPNLEVIASMGIAHIDKHTLNAIEKLDIADEHTYKSIYWPMIYNNWYDQYTRKDWSMYVGEYACNGGVGKGNMMAALNDATSILMFERNADLIKMTSYAPLLENINKPNWDVNLIKFDCAHSFGRISYYVIKMMNENKATINVKTDVELLTKQSSLPLFSGKIGLSTWDTYAEFKDLKIMKDGKVLYSSDFISHKDDWETEGGKWIARDSAIAQTIDGAWPMAVLKNKNFDTYTLQLKARKTGGPNAFMIPIAIKDNKNYLRAHIGAWWNKVSAFEMVINGVDAIVTQPVYFEQPIETNRWYNVEIIVRNTSIECYLNGKLLMTYKDPCRFFSIAGRDEKTGEIVLKVVNAYDKPLHTNIQLKGAKNVSPEGKIITLSAESADAENSLESPHRYVPEEQIYKAFKSAFDMVFKPWSVSILRIKETNL
jgi:alpha-L-arabinofuranosidase